MAMSKSLFKSVALGATLDLGAMVRRAGREISRDNTEGLFVTLWAGVLDVATGELVYCNAGHEPPYVVPNGRERVERLAHDGGPPLCVMDEFPYDTRSHRLNPGDTLCLITDGIVEATSVAGQFYGRARFEALLSALPPGVHAAEVGEAIRRDVAGFAAGVDAADDLAILALRWQGG
jgi:serine phosphatase RsbU (regulator of sigma subunit)